MGSGPHAHGRARARRIIDSDLSKLLVNWFVEAVTESKMAFIKSSLEARSASHRGVGGTALMTPLQLVSLPMPVGCAQAFRHLPFSSVDLLNLKLAKMVSKLAKKETTNGAWRGAPA